MGNDWGSEVPAERRTRLVVWGLGVGAIARTGGGADVGADAGAGVDEGAGTDSGASAGAEATSWAGAIAVLASGVLLQVSSIAPHPQVHTTHAVADVANHLVMIIAPGGVLRSGKPPGLSAMGMGSVVAPVRRLNTGGGTRTRTRFTLTGF